MSSPHTDAHYQDGDPPILCTWGCPKCHTLWREVGEVDLADLDALPEAGQ